MEGEEEEGTVTSRLHPAKKKSLRLIDFIQIAGTAPFSRALISWRSAALKEVALHFYLSELAEHPWTRCEDLVRFCDHHAGLIM